MATYPTASREVCDSVDLIFMNQAEYDGPYGDAQLPVPKAPLHRQARPFRRAAHRGRPSARGGGPVAQLVDLDRRRRGAGTDVFLRCGPSGLPERRALTVRGPRRVQPASPDYGVTGSHLTAELEVIRVEAETTGNTSPADSLAQ